jgi:hypothetical protein
MLNLRGAKLGAADEAALVASPHLARARIYVGVGRLLSRKIKK